MQSEAFHIVGDICFSRSSHLYRSILHDIETMHLVVYQDLGKLV